MFYNNWHHRSNFFWIVNVLTNLRKGHNTSVFIAPVCVVTNCVDHELANKRQHDRFADGRNKSINAVLTKRYVVFLFFFLLEPFLRVEPSRVNFGIDVNHQFEYLLENVFQKVDVLLSDTGLSLNKSYNKLKRLLTNARVCEVLTRDHGFEGLVNVNKVRLEKSGFNFG